MQQKKQIALITSIPQAMPLIPQPTTAFPVLEVANDKWVFCMLGTVLSGSLIGISTLIYYKEDLETALFIGSAMVIGSECSLFINRLGAPKQNLPILETAPIQDV